MLFGQKYGIMDIEDSINHAKEACMNFDLSRKGVLCDMRGNIDAGKLFGNIMTETYSISGEVDVSLGILKLILKSETFFRRGHRGEKLAERFLNHVRLGSADLSSLTADLPDENLKYLDLMYSNRFHKFFSELYLRLKHNLSDAVQLMTDKQIQMSKVAVYTAEFKDMFKVDIMKNKWTEVRESKRSEIEKLGDYRRIFAAVVIKNFRSLVRTDLQFLLNYQEIALEMDNIIAANQEVKWSDGDMRGNCYMNNNKLHFVLIYYKFFQVMQTYSSVSLFLNNRGSSYR